MNNYNIDAQARGERIRKLRLKKNKTQAYFADILYISPSYLAPNHSTSETILSKNQIHYSSH